MVPIAIYASPGAVSARHEQCRVVATGLTRTKVMCDRSPLGFRLATSHCSTIFPDQRTHTSRVAFMELMPAWRREAETLLLEKHLPWRPCPNARVAVERVRADQGDAEGPCGGQRR